MTFIAVLCRHVRSVHRKFPNVQSVVFSRKNLSNAADEKDKKEDRHADDQYDKNVKQEILKASMAFVNDLGWSKEALVKGAESLGYTGTSHGLFPGGGADLALYFFTDCNENLATKLEKDTKENPKIVLPDFLHGAIEHRLRMIMPYLPIWPKALALMALPQNVPRTLTCYMTLIDDISYYAGDRSVDFTWYSRRIGLAGIYKATELYLLQDKSADYKDTWKFLTRRLEAVVQVDALIHGSGQFGNQLPSIAQSFFATARHMMGVSQNR